MTGRDRMVVIVISVFAVLGAAWLLVVSPQRKQVSQLDAQVTEASAKLAAGESELANARTAQAQYTSAYASIVSLGKAVPPSKEVPSLIYQLALASSQKKVEFASIVSGSGGGPSSASSAPAATTAAAAGFSQMPFTFVFNGGFFDLYHLFQQLNRFTVRTASGGLQVSGRLLTVQSVKLGPATGSESAKSASTGQLTGTITATAYTLSAAQGLTGGGTATSPAGVATAAVPTASGASSPTAPAIARVTP